MLLTLIVLSASSFMPSRSEGGEKKEVTLTGQLMCGHCELGEGKDCHNVLQVTEEGKSVNYYFSDKGKKESYHESIHGGGRKDAKVTGVLTKKKGKVWIAPSKVELLEKK